MKKLTFETNSKQGIEKPHEYYSNNNEQKVTPYRIG